MNIAELAGFQEKQILAYNTLLQDDCKYLLFGGAASGGKSYFLRWIAIALAIFYYNKYNITGVPIGLFSEDYPTLKDRQISRIKREIPGWIGQLKESRDEGYIFQLSPKFGSGIILLRNLDDPSKYQSVEFAAICVEELTKNPRETFDDLRFRLRYPGISDPRFVGATNPGGIGHGWVKALWITGNTTDPEQNLFKFIPARYDDNKYIDLTYVDQLKALPEQKRMAYMEGSWDVFAGQYFPEISAKHIIPPFVPHDAVIVGGMDWGRTNPFSFHLATVEKIYYRKDTGGLDSFYRTKTFFEVYGTERDPREWSRMIKDEMWSKYRLRLDDVSWVQCDPTIFNKGNDNSVSIRDQFYADDNGWRILQPAKNERILGWNIMHNWLSLAPDGLPFWQWTTNCVNLDRTLPELVHDEKHVEDVDTDGEDHAGDDQRYMLRNIKLIDGKTGMLNAKQETPQAAGLKFYGKADDAGQLIVDPSKFR